MPKDDERYIICKELFDKYPDDLQEYQLKGKDRLKTQKQFIKGILEILTEEEDKEKYNKYVELQKIYANNKNKKDKSPVVNNTPNESEPEITLTELTKCEDNNKRLKTPLRYAGGKSKAIYKLEKHLPKMYDNMEIHDCFLGGGSFPLYLTKLYPNLKVRVNDVYFPLYNFWVQLRDYGDKLSDTLNEIKKQNNSPELARELFDKQKKVIDDENKSDFDKAVAFYILNKCSFSGLVSSSFSTQASVSNFGESGINNLKVYSKLIKSWEIYNMDYKDFIHEFSNHENVFLYLDPPYMIKDNLYGDHGELHKVFKHEEFFDLCPKLKKCKQLISYNSDLLIKNAFVGYNISDYDLTYTLRSTGTYMEDQKSRKELAMRNY